MVTFSMPNFQTSTSKEETEIFALLGKKLAYLLAVSSLPAEAKEAWAALVPKMNFEQIERLAALLERDVAGQDPEFQSLSVAIKAMKEKRIAEANDSAEDPLAQFSNIKKAL